MAAGVLLTAGLTIASAAAAPATDLTASPVDAATAPVAEAPAEATAIPEPVPAPSGEATEEPAADPTPKKADYAGAVQGNGGLLAISIRNGKAVAYFCDGRIEAWLKGKAENNTVVLEGKNAVVTAALGGGKAQGRLQFKNKQWRFVAPLVKKPSGLYRATAAVRGARVVGGWIRLPDGRSVGLIGPKGSAGEEAAPFTGEPVTWYGITLTPEDPDAFIDEINP